jgi:phenylacetate-CoA ligase
MIDLDQLRRSPFYRRKIDGSELPFTTKAELAADQAANPPYGTNLARPLADYARLHQTSGTTSGRPLCWLDTPESWDWIVGRWDVIYRQVGIQANDRFYFAFSFGPFLGFWSAFEAAQRSGYFCLPGGGVSSAARLRQILEHRITVVLCTPTYALHLAEIAGTDKLDLASSSVRAMIVAGEPGGLIPATRQRIESAWGARVFDHYGLTEVGPVAIEPADEHGGLLVVDGYEAEVIDAKTLQPAADGQVGELVLTNLGRLDSPLARYRTGDLVRGVVTPHGLRLEGGILGRADDMIHIRGNNVYPTAIESIIRRCPEVAEFRVEIDASKAMTELTITVEPTPNADALQLVTKIEQSVRDELQFRPKVVAVAAGTLPRFEMKARRFIKK